MALQEKISWDTLIVFLDDLTSTLDKSKQANIVLVKELQKMHFKLQEKGAEDNDIYIIDQLINIAIMLHNTVAAIKAAVKPPIKYPSYCHGCYNS